MNPIHPNMTVWASFKTKDPARLESLPELKDAVWIHDISKYHADVKSDIRVALHIVGPERAVRALQKCRVHIVSNHLIVDYSKAFWDKPPADCAGALLSADGCVALPDATLYWRIVPLCEPIYTIGRPEADSEHSRFKPHALSHVGGVQVVSDELLTTLRKLGAEGQTGVIIYRGSNKKAYDTVQQGYKRFLPQPEYELPFTTLGIEFLPKGIPNDFGICSMLRIPEGCPATIPGIQRNLADDRWYDIALALNQCKELRALRRSVLLTPMFSRGGQTDSWVTSLQSSVEELKT